MEKNENIEKLLSSNEKDLEEVFSQLSLKEIEDLITRVCEVDSND